MSSLSKQDMLREISQDASRLAQSTHKFRRIAMTTTQQKLAPYHSLTIPLPRPVTSLFIARGFNATTTEVLNQTYLDKAASLKQVYEDEYYSLVKRCQDEGAFQVFDMDQLILAMQSTLMFRYEEHLQDWQSKLDTFSRRRFHADHESFSQVVGQSTSAKDISGGRPTFKSESVPLLEEAFITNAYPSRTDKERLAKETGMEYKQVNIWFQNRRARSKKEGNPLQRTATFATQLSSYSIRSPTSEFHFTDATKEERSTSLPEKHVVTVSDAFANPSTSIVRPAHVFPTPYPPFLDEEPFPVKNGAGSFQTIWIRKCATGSIQHTVVGVEQLTAQMANLSLSDDTSSGYCRTLPSFALVPPRAPLPALIRMATASSRAQPVATFVCAAGSCPISKVKESRSHRPLPTRLPVDEQAGPRSPTSVARQSIRTTSPISMTSRSRRSETRSPSPLYTSRSSSSSSIASSRSTSSSWSVASSDGPITPITTSPRIKALALTKEAFVRTTFAPRAPIFKRHR